MTTQQSIAQHLGLMYRVAGANLEGMTHEQSLAHPAPGGNCANWILGHMTNVHNGLMGLIGEAPVWEDEQLLQAGFDPITDPGSAIKWTTLRDRFFGASERCLAAVAKLSDAALAETVPHPFGGTCSRAELLNTLAFHQTYHAGQLGVIRRIAGLEGAVKAPGQEQAQPG